MGFWELAAAAVGLSADAFAVAVGKGLASRRFRWQDAGLCGLWFGGFQALMPLLGYFLGVRFAAGIGAIDHWVAFVLLTSIGLGMLGEAWTGGGERADDSYAVRRMLPLAAATSIDALTVGVTFAFLEVNIWRAAIVIGITTAVLSACGVRIGAVFGEKYASGAQMVGGLLLIGLGLRMIIGHFAGF